MIDLEEFITTVLLDVIKGVAGAQQAASELGATINDHVVLRETERTSMVDFDVEVSTSESSSRGAKGGVFVGKSGAGARGDKAAENRGVGRIRFSVPVHLPNGDPTNRERDDYSNPFGTEIRPKKPLQ